MAKGFLIGSNDFDVLFEAAFSNFATTTFSGLSPTCIYCTRYYGSNPNANGYYKYNTTIFDASPRGFLPSNTKVATVTTTGQWMTIKRESTGFSVNGTTYRNSSRGSYPINRVGLVFCGGGGGASGWQASSWDNSWATYRQEYSAQTGSAGGGGGTVACVLNLDAYNYSLYLGNGGASAGWDTKASSGGDSTLKLTSSSGTTLAIAYGGEGGYGYNYWGTAAGGSTYLLNNSSYYTGLGGVNGGGGGENSYYNVYWDSYGELSEYSHRGPYEVIGGSTSTANYYLSQQVSGSKITIGSSAVANYEPDPIFGDDIGFPSGGACAITKISGSAYGFGGDGYMDLSIQNDSAYGSGENGNNSVALLFY